MVRKNRSLRVAATAGINSEEKEVKKEANLLPNQEVIPPSNLEENPLPKEEVKSEVLPEVNAEPKVELNPELKPQVETEEIPQSILESKVQDIPEVKVQDKAEEHLQSLIGSNPEELLKALSLLKAQSIPETKAQEEVIEHPEAIAETQSDVLPEEELEDPAAQVLNNIEAGKKRTKAKDEKFKTNFYLTKEEQKMVNELAKMTGYYKYEIAAIAIRAMYKKAKEKEAARKAKKRKK